MTSLAAESFHSEAGLAVVVDSIGTAGAGIIATLGGVLQRPAQLVARTVLRAPAPLIEGLDPASADTLAGQLRQAGLEVSVRPAGAVPEPGEGAFEIAIRVRDIARIDAVLAEVAALLGLDGARARALLIQDPCVLLGGVSLATVEAVRRRLEPLGVLVDVSRPAEARFDLFAGTCPPVARSRLLMRLREAGIAAPAGAQDGGGQDGGPLLATDLDHAAASAAWAAVRAAQAPAMVVNRDYQRFDVRLVRAAPGPDLTRVLTERVGMPAAAVPRVLGNLPVVLASQAGGAEAAELMAALADAGAECEATLLFTQRFGLLVERLGDGARADAILKTLGGVPAGERQRVLDGHAGALPGPFTHLQARWLVHALGQAGTRARVSLP